MNQTNIRLTICNKCVGQLKVAYEFRKQAEYTDKYLRQVIIHHKEELNQPALGKQGLYYKMVLQIFHTQIKLEQDDQIEQLTDFESKEVPMVNIPHTLEEGINCKGTARLTDRVPVYAVIEEADIKKIQEIKQINLFKIAQVTSIPKTEFKQTGEITGSESCSQEDIDSLTDDIQIKVEQGDQMKQLTYVKSEKISEIIEEGIQYKGNTCGADTVKIDEIEKMQETIFTKTKVTSIHKDEDDQTDKFGCIKCGAHFKRKDSFKRHLLIHSGERPYKCKICDRNFAQKSYLKKHSRTHSDKSTCGADQSDKFECIVCGARFIQKRSLKRHSYIHSGERPYKCKICGRRFAQSDGLTRHSQIHLNKRPFLCNLCDRTFTQKNTLERHLRRHLGKRLYECNFCDRSFSLRSQLASHLRRHAESSYTCEICGSSFRYEKDLKSHILMKHENQKRAEVKIIVETPEETRFRIEKEAAEQEGTTL